MRLTPIALLLAFALATPFALAEPASVQTRHYQSLWPAEELAYVLGAVADGALVCDPVTVPPFEGTMLARSLGGVCFDVPAGHRTVSITARSHLLVFTPPTFVLWWQDAQGEILHSEGRCAPDLRSIPVPEGSVRLMALAIDGMPGCPTGPAIWGVATARFHS